MSLLNVICLSPSFGSTSPSSVKAIEAAGGELVWRTQGAEDWTPPGHPPELADAVALIVGTQPVDAEMIAAAPNLRIVAKHGAGVDNIDVEAATRAGVVVTNAPGANATAVAELVMGLVLGLSRGIVHQDDRVRSGRWGVPIGRALEGSTLGIVGMGRIGRLVAARAAAFEMEIVAHDELVAGTPGAAEDPWAYVDLSTLLSTADFVSLHVPLLPETEGLISTDALNSMKSSAFLINASRGKVVDEEALDRALTDGEIAGAALDVFEKEPVEPSHPLVAQRERTILTPHMGAYTDRALAKTSDVTATNIAAALGGTTPPDALNQPEPWRGATAG